MNQTESFPPPTTAPANPGSSNLPEGWIARWSPEHNAWYFVNTYTQESVWQPPTVPATPQNYSTPASPPLSTYDQSYNPNWQITPASTPFNAPESGKPNDSQPFSPIPPYTPPNAGSAPGYFQQGNPNAPPEQYPGSPPPTNPNYQPQSPPVQDASGADAKPGEGAEGERGLISTLGKTAAGAGAGILLGGILGHESKKHSHFNFSMPQSIPSQGAGFFGSISNAWSSNNNNSSPPPPPPQHHSHHAGSSLLSGAAALGGLGAAWSHQNNNNNNNSNNNYNSPMPMNNPSQPYHAGPPPQSSPGLFANVGNSLGFNGPQLTIWSANYGSGDCTEKARELITPRQTLDLTDNGDKGVYDNLFGDNWCGNPKSLCILYQYGNRPLELLVTCQNGGNPVIRGDESIRPDRRAFITECGPVVAVVWGIMEGRDKPVPANVIQDIASYKIFTASNDYFGFNGWSKATKSCVIFLNRDGRLYNTAVREGGTGRI